MFHKSRLEIKILGLIIFSLVLGFGALILWDAERDVKNMIKQNQEKANLMAATIAKSIKNIMYSGNADIVIDWLEELKEVKEINKAGDN